MIFFQLNHTAVVKGNKIVQIPIRLSAKGLSLLWRLQCVGGPCTANISYQNTYSRARHSERLSFEESFHPSTKTNFIMQENLVSNQFNISVQSANLTSSTNQSFRYYLEAFNTGCFYWNEIDNEWSSNGCKVTLSMNFIESD